MKNSAGRAFTLIELLVVIAVIAVLAGIALPVYGTVQLAAKRTQSLSNMKQLGTACVAFCGDNNGVLPGQGASKTPSWASTATENVNPPSWYNVLPRTYANSKGVGDFANDPADFYTKTNLLYVPAAKYPSTKLTTPLFAITMNSKLQTTAMATPRLQEIQFPAETVLFQETGLQGETAIRGQSAYSGNQPYTYASRTVARYGGKTILVFVDGHADIYTGTSVVNTAGQAYFPITSAAPTIYWEVDPTVTPNK